MDFTVKTLQELIQTIGLSATILCVIGFLIYLIYSKMKPDTNSSKLVDTLMERVSYLENDAKELRKIIANQSKIIADLRVRVARMEAEKGLRPISSRPDLTNIPLTP